MANRAVGVVDQASGAGVAEVRVRERTISAATYAEQYVIPTRERVTTAILLYSVLGTVAAAAQTANTGGFFWIFNNVASGVTIALRRINFTSQHNTALATPTGPRLSLIRGTFTGTPSGTAVTGAKALSSQSASANWSVRSAITGATVTEVATAFSFFPVAAVTAVGACAPAYEDLNPEDEGMLQLAAGECLVMRQVDAGTASDTRRFVANFALEEYTLP